MRKLLLIFALPLVVLPGFAQSRDCLRVMPLDELIRGSILIGRVKVLKTDKARYRGSYGQVGVLLPVDIIDGDFTMTEINVLARSNVRCAEDNYKRDQEMLVFLEPEDSLFHTVNYQFGQFMIEREVVKGWRDKNNNAVDKPYAEVRQEILKCLSKVRHPQVENSKPPNEVQKTAPPAPVKPPQSLSEPSERP